MKRQSVRNMLICINFIPVLIYLTWLSSRKFIFEYFMQWKRHWILMMDRNMRQSDSSWSRMRSLSYWPCLLTALGQQSGGDSWWIDVERVGLFYVIFVLSSLLGLWKTGREIDVTVYYQVNIAILILHCRGKYSCKICSYFLQLYKKANCLFNWKLLLTLGWPFS